MSTTHSCKHKRQTIYQVTFHICDIEWPISQIKLGEKWWDKQKLMYRVCECLRKCLPFWIFLEKCQKRDAFHAFFRSELCSHFTPIATFETPKNERNELVYISNDLCCTNESNVSVAPSWMQWNSVVIWIDLNECGGFYCILFGSVFYASVIIRCDVLLLLNHRIKFNKRQIEDHNY